MHRSRQLVIFLAFGFTITLSIAATAFRLESALDSHVGLLSPAAAMLSPRSGHSATLLQDGRVLIAGGMRRNQDFYKSAELYDPATGNFQPTGDMNERRVGHVAALLRSGKVLIAGGWIGGGCTDSAEIYDPATGKFTSLAVKMTTMRGDATSTVLENGDVLIAGGSDHDTPGGIAATEIFNAAAMTFQRVGAMHAGRVSQTATLLRDGRVLMVGGRGEKVNASAEIYDPKTARFTETGSLLTAPYKHTAGLLPDGRVLIAGGSDERDWSGNLNSAEIYDPRTGKFIAASSMNDSRFKLPNEAVQLASRQLLIAGGSKQLEVFDPRINKFLVVPGEMSDGRHFMSETKLRDGRVLLAGGYPNNDRATAQSWIYKP